MSEPVLYSPSAKRIVELEDEIDRLRMALSDAGEVISYKSNLVLEREAEIERLKERDLEFFCWMSNESQIVSGCFDEYERGRYEAFRQALDKREATKE